MPKSKKVFNLLPSWVFTKKSIYPAIYFWGIYFFISRVITNFGSNFLKISRDFANMGTGSKISSKVNTFPVFTFGIYLKFFCYP